VSWLAERSLSPAASIERTTDGSITVKTPVAAREVFIGWIIGFDDAAEVLGPPQLRTEFIDRVQGVA